MRSKYEFWKDWKDLSPLEKAGIKSLKKAKKMVLKNIPKDKIIAIYAGGSFVRREMDKKSDVDIWAIVTENNLLNILWDLEEKHRERYKPHLGISGYSLWELKKGKRWGAKLRANPSRFIKRINDYKLIYGSPLSIRHFAIRTDTEDLIYLIKAFEEIFLPGHQEGKLGFQDIIKQVFWLAECEFKVKGKNPPYSWKGLASLAPRNHIIHKALKLRETKTKDPQIRSNFILKLKRYLKTIKRKYR